MNKSSTRYLKNVIGTFLILFSLLFTASSASAQDMNAKITQSIKTSNATELGKYFNNTIDLTIPSSEGTYSKVQAEQILKNFFAKFPPVSFTINHKGNSNDGSMFAIGTYKSATQSFRTYFLTKPVDGKLFIHQLKFELTED